MSRAGWKSPFSLYGEDPNQFSFNTSAEDKAKSTVGDEQQAQIGEGFQRLTKGLTDWSQAKVDSSLYKREGKNALRVGAKNAINIRKAGRTLLGQNKAIAGASGIDPSTGSAKLVEDTVTRNVESDASQALLEGNLANLGAKFKSRQSQIAGQSALWGGVLGAGSSFLGAYNKGQA